jgi:hypothetical protein
MHSTPLIVYYWSHLKSNMLMNDGRLRYLKSCMHKKSLTRFLADMRQPDPITKQKQGRTSRQTLELPKTDCLIINRIDTVSSPQVVSWAGELESHIECAFPELLIVFLLGGGHVGVQDHLLLGRQTSFHVRLDAPQQEGLQDCMQLTQYLHITP